LAPHQPSPHPLIYPAPPILGAALLPAKPGPFHPHPAPAGVTGGPALGAGAALPGGVAVGGAGALAGAGIAGAGAMASGGAARLAAPARAAAGAGSGRPPAPPNSQGPSTPKPSNDNPPPSSPGRASGGAMATTPPSGPRGVNEPAAAWRPQTASDAGATSETVAEATPTPGGPDTPKDATGRSPGTIAAEARAARADFHRAASRPATAAGAGPRGRSAALQAFFVANTGRGLMPAGETSGVLSPNLKTEES
ncbi:MAG: P-type conjugative transfer protein TrbL, partial [Brevundimonas sp.]|nr:P-type conjugative transfer protein TrbL [Brevundimonas sp.]